MLLVKYEELLRSKDKKQIKEDNMLKNNYSYIHSFDLDELKLLKYKCEMKAKKLRNRTTVMTTFSVIITLLLALISIRVKVIEKFDIYEFANILEVFMLNIISVSSFGMYVKVSLDTASEYETLVVMITERITEIKASNWNKAQLVKTQIIN